MNQDIVDQIKVWGHSIDVLTPVEKASAYDRLKPLVPQLFEELTERGQEINKLLKRIESLDFDNKNLKTLADRRFAESEALMAELRKQAGVHRDEIRALERASVDRIGEVKKNRLDIETLTAENSKLTVIASRVSQLETEATRREAALKESNQRINNLTAILEQAKKLLITSI